MRVAERGPSQARTEPSGRGRFGEALRRAQDGGGRAPGDARLDARRAGRAGRDPGSTGEPRADERGAPAPQPAPAPTPSPDPHATPALAALARALPVAIAAAAAREGAPLALSFGRSLDVELRTSAGGVALLLRPEPRLERAAEAELPRLVAALRARGVAVALADVQPRGGARRPR